MRTNVILIKELKILLLEVHLQFLSKLEAIRCGNAYKIMVESYLTKSSLYVFVLLLREQRWKSSKLKKSPIGED